MINFTISHNASTTANIEGFPVVSATNNKFVSTFILPLAEADHGEEQTHTNENQEKSIDEYQWEQYKILKPRIWNVSKMLADS